MGVLQQPILATIYGLAMVQGVLTMAYPSTYVSDVLGVGIVFFYGASFVCAGALALIGVLRPNFKLEAVALWPLFGAYALYDVALWTLLADQIVEGEPLPAVYGPAIAVAIVALFFLGKAVSLLVKTKQLVRAAVEHERN